MSPLLVTNKGIGRAIRDCLDRGIEPDPAKIAAECGASENSVRARISTIKRSRYAKVAAPPTKAPSTALLPLEELNALTPEGRISRLRGLAESGTEQVQLAALKYLDELHTRSAGGLGPPAPLTSDERIQRLAKLLTAVTPQEAHDAWNLAQIQPPPNYTPPPPKSDSSSSSPPSSTPPSQITTPAPDGRPDGSDPPVSSPVS